MSSMQPLGYLEVEVSTRRPSNKSWGSGSADATDEGSRSPKSTNFPTTTCPTVFAGMGVKPGLSVKGWFRTGNDLADERLTSGSLRVDEILSWDNRGVTLAMDSECKGVGGKKVDTKVETTNAGLPWAADAPAEVEGAEKPIPDALKEVACEDRRSHHRMSSKMMQALVLLPGQP